MNMRVFKALCLSAPLLGLAACSSNDDPSPNQDEGRILIETTVKNPDGSSGSSYIQIIPDFTKQTIDNKNSIQVGSMPG